MVTKRIVYYGVVCLLSAYILADIAPWLVWQFGPLASIDID